MDDINCFLLLNVCLVLQLNTLGRNNELLTTLQLLHCLVQPRRCQADVTNYRLYFLTLVHILSSPCKTLDFEFGLS